MKVTEHLAQAKSTLISFEILPPLKGQGIKSIYDAIDPLMEFNPPFVDVTYHREEYVYKRHPTGLLEKQTTRKRPGTVGICAAIINKYGIDAIPHIICGGFSREETENALIDLNFLGIDNVLALRGDQIKSEAIFEPEPDGHAYASDLIEQIVRMNEGKYLNEELGNNASSDFCIGVAGYPEKHFEAPNFKNDLKWLKKKVDLGAEYIVTQMFFDNSKYFDFVRQCREIGIDVPIIPGLKPLTTKSQLTILPKIFHIDIPEDLADAVAVCKDNDAVKEVAIEWGVQQAKELIASGAPCLHYYTMGKPDVTKAIVSQVL
ncbi:MAG: methylenetetrahydrofolate reductase [NAD(P)H] [Bacteroidetes bacterium]|nr:methylenetetrahydrofolate reductase [NAD(P)H] [Bacteroidota bacterium]MDA0973478.1 methylenetetrahydrofolate reductase [NAD(P)H] [Bacteroidota bacterium]